MRFPSRSEAETRRTARALAACIDARGLVIALCGPLGAGKTAFVKGLAEGLGIDPRLVASPSFVIASEYPGPRRLAHVDLYRVESEAELEAAGFLDLLEAGAVVAVEWADRLPDALPKDRLEVTIARPASADGDEASRTLAVHARGPVARAAAACWSGRLGGTANGRGEGSSWP